MGFFPEEDYIIGVDLIQDQNSYIENGMKLFRSLTEITWNTV